MSSKQLYDWGTIEDWLVEEKEAALTRKSAKTHKLWDSGHGLRVALFGELPDRCRGKRVQEGRGQGAARVLSGLRRDNRATPNATRLQTSSSGGIGSAPEGIKNGHAEFGMITRSAISR